MQKLLSKTKQTVIKQYKTVFLSPVLVKIVNTIQDLAKLYASSEFKPVNKKQFETWLKEDDTTEMEIFRYCGINNIK